MPKNRQVGIRQLGIIATVVAAMPTILCFLVHGRLLCHLQGARFPERPVSQAGRERGRERQRERERELRGLPQLMAHRNPSPSMVPVPKAIGVCLVLFFVLFNHLITSRDVLPTPSFTNNVLPGTYC